MKDFLAVLGSIAVLFLVLKIIQIFFSIREYKYGQIVGARHVYRAAKYFAQGAKEQKVIETMLKCSYFTQLEVNQIVLKAKARPEINRMRAFLDQVNHQIGDDIF